MGSLRDPQSLPSSPFGGTQLPPEGPCHARNRCSRESAPARGSGGRGWRPNSSISPSSSSSSLIATALADLLSLGLSGLPGHSICPRRPARHRRVHPCVGPGVVHFLEDDEPLSGAAGAPIGKHQFLVDRLWRANTDGLEDMFRVKWVGWKSPELGLGGSGGSGRATRGTLASSRRRRPRKRCASAASGS